MIDTVTVFNLLVAGLIFWSSFLLCDLSLKRTGSGLYVYLIVFGIFIADCALYYFTPISEFRYVWYLFALFPMFVLPFFYKNQLTMIVFTYFSSLLFSLMIQITVKISEYLIYMNFPSVYVTLDTALILMIALSLYTICIPAFIRIAFEKISKTASEKALWITWVFPVLCFLTLMLNDYRDSIYTITIIRYMSTLLLMIFVTYVAFYMMLTSQGKITSSITKPAVHFERPKPRTVSTANNDSLILYEKQYFESLINSYNDTLDRAYVLEKGLHTIQRFINEDNIPEAMRCLDQLRYELEDIQLLDISGNSIVDTLLSYYHYLFIKDHLKLKFDIHLPMNKMRDLDLCILFGGLLQNAYDLMYECQITDGEVLLECRTQGGKLQVTCANTFTGKHNDMRKAANNFNLRCLRELAGNYKGALHIECPQDILYVYVDLFV